MQVHRDLTTLPVFNHAVITIGTFDGVHIGHQQILEQLKEEAKKINGETVIITFHPHPRKIVHREQIPLSVLSTLDEKIELLESRGIDHLVVVPFDQKFSDQTAEKYIRDFLVAKFHPSSMIIGYDHRFGKGRTGDYHLLESYGKRLGFLVKEIPGHVLRDVIISSTRIRESLLNRDIRSANEFLGYEYFFDGTVVEGNKLGRTLGFPTANLQISEEKLIPGNGVYAVSVQTGEPGKAVFRGMMNIGLRPTVNGTVQTTEVNIFNFSQDIYGATIRVFVKDFLRGEIKFNNLEELKAQLAKDRESALKIFPGNIA